MFIKQNANKIIWNSNWFITDTLLYKQYLYEDIFIRKYIASFFFKWTKVFKAKIIGSIYIFRTLGKLYIDIFFFFPTTKIKTIITVARKKLLKFSRISIKPIFKCKKQLSLILCFYKLETLLRTQIFFKFTNICSLGSVGDGRLLLKLFSFLAYKLSYFKQQFKHEVYINTIQVFLNIFKLKKPDSVLLANYLAAILVGLHKHTHYLLFVKKILQNLYKFFTFNGIRILLSGKLNGFSRAQAKHIQIGCVSFQTFTLPFTEGLSSAFTKAGKIGVKVWIC